MLTLAAIGAALGNFAEGAILAASVYLTSRGIRSSRK